MESFHFDHVRLLPSQQIGMHTHHTWELSCVVVGDGVRTIGDTTQNFRVGDIVLLPPDIPHQWRFRDLGTPIENISIEFGVDELARLAEPIPEMLPLARAFASIGHALTFFGKTQERLLELMRKMTMASMAGRFALIVEALDVIAQTEESQAAGYISIMSETERKLKKIDIFIACNFQKHIAIADIAEHVGMNRTSLCSFYRKHTGKTIFGAILERRIGLASHLLTSTEMRVQDVCFQCGFTDMPYFCRVFKDRVGVSPTEWRESRNMDINVDKNMNMP